MTIFQCLDPDPNSEYKSGSSNSNAVFRIRDILRRIRILGSVH